VTVLYLGQVAEWGPTGAVLGQPAHPYTKALRSAVPQIGLSETRRSRILLAGTPPDPACRPSGCVFHPRCPIAIPRCQSEVPELAEVSPGRHAACHRAADVLAGAVGL
jgi:peptide/nickel transport system ATP-binding protein